MKALVVLSGGQDSTTCLALAIAQHGVANVHAVTFDYGQRHSVEILAARKIAFLAGIAEFGHENPVINKPSRTIDGRHEVIAVPHVLKGSSPLVNAKAAVEQYESAAVLPGGLEKTFVPMRNMLFLTLAANRAAVIAHEAGDRAIEIWTGVSQEDYGGYPDCREVFIKGMEAAVNISLDDKDMPAVYMRAPLMHMTKAQTVELSERPSVAARALLAHSHTCYNGSIPPCGTCHACLLRAKGYAEAGVIDPLIERLQSDPESGTSRDPVHEEKGQWYFWDETWADRLGPYPTEAIARSMLKGYAANL